MAGPRRASLHAGIRRNEAQHLAVQITEMPLFGRGIAFPNDALVGYARLTQLVATGDSSGSNSGNSFGLAGGPSVETEVVASANFEELIAQPTRYAIAAFGAGLRSSHRIAPDVAACFSSHFGPGPRI
jgi:hypothetical protein